MMTVNQMNLYIKSLKSEISELEALIAGGGHISKGFVLGGMW